MILIEFVFVSFAARAAPEHALQALEASHRALVREIVAREVVPSNEPIAFVPITAADFLTLAKNGVARRPGGFEAFANLENPVVARFQRERPDLRVSALPAELRRPLVHFAAWTRGVSEELRARALRAGHRPARFEGVMAQFLARLLEHVPGDRRVFSPGLETIVKAAMGLTRIELPESTLCENQLGFYMEDLLVIASNPEWGLARRRARAFAALLDVPGDDIGRGDAPAGRALTALFADLPLESGLVVSLSRAAFNRVRWDRLESPRLFAIESPFILGIEALGAAERDLLARYKPN